MRTWMRVKMVDRRGTLNIFYNVLLLIVFICCIKVNKPRYLTSDRVIVTLNINGTFDAVAESYISSSLFIFKSNREFLCFGCRKSSFLTLLLLLCGDIERCPGPPSITAFSKQRGIKFLHQNICGLLKKIPQLETFVSVTMSKSGVISLSETHINGPTDDDELYKLPGYKFIKNNTKNGLGSGVGIVLKNGLNYKLRDDLQNLHIESIWLEIFVFKTKSVFFGCYYLPPESSKYFSNDSDQLILEQLETVNRLDKEVISWVILISTTYQMQQI